MSPIQISFCSEITHSGHYVHITCFQYIFVFRLRTYQKAVSLGSRSWLVYFTRVTEVLCYRRHSLRKRSRCSLLLPGAPQVFASLKVNTAVCACAEFERRGMLSLSGSRVSSKTPGSMFGF